MGKKRSKKRIDFEAEDFFAFRVPLLPFSAYLDWECETAAVGSFQERRTAVLASLADHMKDPVVREALFLASPTLYQAWTDLDGNLQTAGATGTVRSLMRYFARMCSRPTPFGLFAGHGLGQWAARSELRLDAKETNTRYTQPDSGYLAELGRTLLADPGLLRRLTWSINSSLYPVEGGYKYLREDLKDGRISYSLLLVDDSAHLSAVLECARTSTTFDALFAAIRSVEDDESEDVSAQDIESYLGDLVQSQLLVSRVGPISSGPAPLDDYVAELPTEHPAAKTLEALSRSLSAVDQMRTGVAPREYVRIAQQLEKLPTRPSIDRLFQVDMFIRPKGATLGPSIRRELGRVVQLAQRLSPPHRNPMQEFITRFRERFGTASAPLMVALDPEEGVGFEGANDQSRAPSPLLNDLPLGDDAVATSIALSPTQVWLLEKIRENGDGCDELVLSNDDIDRIGGGECTVLPDSFSVMFALSAASSQALDEGDYEVIFRGITGPSGARLFGRFGYGDADLREHTRRYVRKEEARRPNELFAEVVHLPEGRMANVIARPQLRAHEIEVLGTSSARDTVKLPVRDLFLRVQGERLVLFSRSLARTVEPRITNAHRLSQGLNVYRFLGQLQSQDATGIGFAFGESLAQLCRNLPRLRYGRVTLAVAQWRVDRHEIESLNSGDAKARFESAQRWRLGRRMPRFAALIDADNRLLVDFENPLSVDAFAHLVRHRPQCTLEEAPLSPERLIAQGLDGSYTHEYVVPFSKISDPPSIEPESASVDVRAADSADPVPSPTTDPLETPPQLAFLPGSEWLYLKFYGSPRSLDMLLTDLLGQRLQRRLEDGSIRKWFFIRYSDPDPHLRVRLHGDAEVLLQDVLPSLSRAMRGQLERSTRRGMVVDTYERETDRYGGPRGIELAEEIFWADSEAALAILGDLEGDDGHEARWKLCFRGLDQLLDDFGYPIEAKRSLMASLRDSFRAEFGAKLPLTKGIGLRYRTEAAELSALLDRSTDATSWLEPGFRALQRRSFRVRGGAAKLVERARNGELSTPLGSVICSLLHMHVNRMIPSDARAHELVLYDLLYRTYDGAIARRKAQAASRT